MSVSELPCHLQTTLYMYSTMFNMNECDFPLKIDKQLIARTTNQSKIQFKINSTYKSLTSTSLRLVASEVHMGRNDVSIFTHKTEKFLSKKLNAHDNIRCTSAETFVYIAKPFSKNKHTKCF